MLLSLDTPGIFRAYSGLGTPKTLWGYFGVGHSRSALNFALVAEHSRILWSWHSLKLGTPGILWDGLAAGHSTDFLLQGSLGDALARDSCSGGGIRVMGEE